MFANLVTMSITPQFIVQLTQNLKEQNVLINKYLICKQDDEEIRKVAQGWNILNIADDNDTFATAHNKAMQYIKGHLVLISDDAVFATNNGLYKLLQSPWDITGTLIQDGQWLNHAGHVFSYNDGKIYNIEHLGRNAPVENYFNQGYIYVEGTTFACVYIKRHIWDIVRGFDEQFVWGVEDVDFCLKARQLGFNIRVDTDCLVFHKEMSTRNNKFAKLNTQKLLAKWN